MWTAVMAAVLAGGMGAASVGAASPWRAAPLPPKKGHDSFGQVAAVGAKDIWAAAYRPALLERFDGRRWWSMPTPGAITALSATPSGDVWALTSGQAHRWDGKSWRAMRSVAKRAHVILAAVPGGAWLSEQGRLSRYDGRRWHPVPAPADLKVSGIRVQGGAVWVVGRHETGTADHDPLGRSTPAVLRWNGRALDRVPVSVSANTRSMLQIDDLVVGKGGDLWLSGHSVLDGDRLPVLHRRGAKWTTLTPPRTRPPDGIEPDGAGGVWFDYGLDQPLWRNRAGKWTKVAAPEPPPGRALGLFSYTGSGVTAHIPGTTLLVRAGATHISPGRLINPETGTRADESTDRLLVTGPYR
ncbi:hypothetical protein FDA94_36210 [Herbidospora galbida]|uniref:Exo-alpha-sialidase n=1 Tax=Herbidospora galbida TaxID=2575442 RepID=A0A4U3LWI3_9ACTN|nr:hypothetical protein [Herbidospora galbida]TKK79017.1 hypothetical protein FDA94_36210 [Herbidospora galbida]